MIRGLKSNALWRAVLAKEPLSEVGTIISEPVLIGTNWHVMKVLAIRPAKAPELQDEKVFAAVRDQLLVRKQRDIQMALMQELSSRCQVICHHAAPGMQPTVPPAVKK